MNSQCSHGAEVRSIRKLQQCKYDSVLIIYINNKYDNKKSKWTMDSAT